MEMTGFTEEQLTVREAISHICSKFPNTYWQERDQLEKDPTEFHAALAKDGWLGIALPESLGGAGLGTWKRGTQYILNDIANNHNRNLRGNNDDADYHSVRRRNGWSTGDPRQRICHAAPG